MSSDPNTKATVADKAVIIFALVVTAIVAATAAGVLLDIWLHG